MSILLRHNMAQPHSWQVLHCVFCCEKQAQCRECAKDTRDAVLSSYQAKDKHEAQSIALKLPCSLLWSPGSEGRAQPETVNSRPVPSTKGEDMSSPPSAAFGSSSGSDAVYAQSLFSICVALRCAAEFSKVLKQTAAGRRSAPSCRQPHRDKGRIFKVPRNKKPIKEIGASE